MALPKSAPLPDFNVKMKMPHCPLPAETGFSPILEIKPTSPFPYNTFPMRSKSLPRKRMGSGCCRSPWRESASAHSTSMLPDFGNYSEQSYSPTRTAIRTLQGLAHQKDAETKRKDIATNTFFFFFNVGNGLWSYRVLPKDWFSDLGCIEFLSLTYKCVLA